MRHHKLFYGSSYDRFTFIIRGAIMWLCKLLNVTIVVKMFKNTRLKSNNINTNFVINTASMNGIRHLRDTGKVKKCLLSSVQTEMFQGVRTQGGMVVKE